MVLEGSTVASRRVSPLNSAFNPSRRIVFHILMLAAAAVNADDDVVDLAIVAMFVFTATPEILAVAVELVDAAASSLRVLMTSNGCVRQAARAADDRPARKVTALL